MALWVPGDTVLKIVGALCVASGLSVFLVRNFFTRDPDGPPTEQQIAGERQARMSMRFVGASVVLLGIAQFIPDSWVRTAVMSCGAAVSIAGVFKVPRRLFAPNGTTS